MLPETTLVVLRQRLAEERARLQADLDDLRIEVDDQQDDYGVSNHPGDDATDLAMREQNMALRRNITDMLEQVQAALGRMDAGTYGICTHCGRPINPERLEALPSAEHCITCQAEIERSH